MSPRRWPHNQGTVNLVGTGNDVVNITDTTPTAGQSGTLTGTMLTGFGMGGGIGYTGVVTFNFNLTRRAPR